MAREFVKLKLSVRREPDPPAPATARMAPPKSVSASSSSQNLNQQQPQAQRGPSRAMSPGRGDSTDGEGCPPAPSAGQASRKPSSACSINDQRTNISIASAATSSPIASPQTMRRAHVPFDPTGGLRSTSGSGGQQSEMISPGGNPGQNTLDHFINVGLSIFGKRK